MYINRKKAEEYTKHILHKKLKQEIFNSSKIHLFTNLILGSLSRIELLGTQLSDILNMIIVVRNIAVRYPKHGNGC